MNTCRDLGVGTGAGAGCSEKKPSSKGKLELHAGLGEANY